MKTERRISPFVTLAVLLASLAVLLLAMRAASEVLSPVVFAFVLAITVTHFMYRLIRLRLPGWLAFMLTLLVVLAVILGMVWLISSTVQDFARSLPRYALELEGIRLSAGKLLLTIGIDLDSLIASETILAPERLMSLAADFTSQLIASLSNWGLILVMAVFFLLEATSMPRKLKEVAGSNNPNVQRFVRFSENVRQFMVITAGLGLIASVLEVILLILLGVDFALLWGAFSFFMSFIPNIGIYLAIIPPALMAYVQYGIPQMVLVIAGFLLINTLINSVVKMRYIRSRLSISNLVIFLSLILWSWVLGPIGAILAVPMSMLIQAILDSREESRWMAYLMSDGSVPFRPEADHDQGANVA
jgi:predicted PurR-regulated permease PerM